MVRLGLDSTVDTDALLTYWSWPSSAYACGYASWRCRSVGDPEPKQVVLGDGWAVPGA